jgi:hypothetical protein
MGLQKIWVNRLIAFLSAALLLTVLIPGSSMAQATSAPAQIISVVVGDRVAYITWNKAPDSDYMTWQKVLVYDQPTGGSVVLETQLTDVQTSFVLGPTELLTNGVTYYAEVQSRFNWVYVASSRVAFTPNLAAAAGTESASLVDIQAFNNSAQIYLEHDPSSSITHYLVAAFPDFTTFSATRAIEVSASEVRGLLSSSGTIQGLTNEALYYFSVAAVNSNGIGPWSSRSGGNYDYPRDYLLARPSLLSVVAGTMQASLQWSAPTSPSSPIVGYRVQYSTNAGLSWASSPNLSTATSQVILLDEGDVPTHFRVAALGSSGFSSFAGAYSDASEPVTASKFQPMFSWSPTATSREDLLSGISLEPFATTNSDGMIQYSVQSAGTAGCTISIIDSTVEATSFGSCTIRAELESRPRWVSATRDIEFSFVEPAAAQDPPSQDPPTQDPPSQQPPVQQPSNEQRGDINRIENFPSSPIVPILAEIDFAKPPKLLGESAVGDRIRLSKFQFENPKRILKVSYRWYSCEVPVKAEADLESSCVRKSKAKGSNYVIKKSDSGSYLSVVMMAKTKKKMLRHLVSTSSSVPE